MILLKHELKKGGLALLLWSIGISFMLGVCILIYPEMAGQMTELSTMFADMGSFTAAFGMDQLNFGEFKGYFGIECGNVLGIGGALYAALLGINALSKEEKEHTAEFLLTHPIARTRVYIEKLLAVTLQIIMMNLVVAAVTACSVWFIGESLPIKDTYVLLLSFLLMQIEIAWISYGLSAILKGNSVGIGIGLALGFYLLNLISNLIEKGKVIKYITPFSYADSATIFAEGCSPAEYIMTGYTIAILATLIGGWKFIKKDIQ